MKLIDLFKVRKTATIDIEGTISAGTHIEKWADAYMTAVESYTLSKPLEYTASLSQEGKVLGLRLKGIKYCFSILTERCYRNICRQIESQYQYEIKQNIV